MCTRFIYLHCLAIFWLCLLKSVSWSYHLVEFARDVWAILAYTFLALKPLLPFPSLSAFGFLILLLLFFSLIFYRSNCTFSIPTQTLLYLVNLKIFFRNIMLPIFSLSSLLRINLSQFWKVWLCITSECQLWLTEIQTVISGWAEHISWGFR